MKKIIPVSLLAIWVACPAFAENFPNDGYMLENKTYDNAATYENMGVYSDSVDAVAEYNDCPANSYCDASGQHSCPSGYPYSAAGAGASTECYKECTTASIPHAEVVSGKDYDGGTDTCSARWCVDGYHVTNDSVDYVSIDSSGNTYSYSGETTPSTYGISGANTFAVDYGDGGVLTGRAKCSTQQMPMSEDGDWWVYLGTLPDSHGDNCWCQLDGYTPSGGTRQSLSQLWVFNIETFWGSEESSFYENCDTGCARLCAVGMFGNGEHRDNMLANLDFDVVGPSACEPNTITINWSDVDGEENPYATNVLYDGDVVTPVKAATYPGKTFIGWRFVAPEEEGGS